MQTITPVIIKQKVKIRLTKIIKEKLLMINILLSWSLIDSLSFHLLD
jgi:hypothetical protein